MLSPELLANARVEGSQDAVPTEIHAEEGLLNKKLLINPQTARNGEILSQQCPKVCTGKCTRDVAGLLAGQQYH